MRMTQVPSLYDPAEDLLSEDGIALFVAEAPETGDAAYIANARCVAARARRLLMTRDGPAEEVGMQAPGYEEGRA